MKNGASKTAALLRQTLRYCDEAAMVVSGWSPAGAPRWKCREGTAHAKAFLHSLTHALTQSGHSVVVDIVEPWSAITTALDHKASY